MPSVQRKPLDRPDKTRPIDRMPGSSGMNYPWACSSRAAANTRSRAIERSLRADALAARRAGRFAAPPTLVRVNLGMSDERLGRAAEFADAVARASDRAHAE